MLNFSKTKIIFIYFLLIVLVFFASLNFVSRDSKLIDKNINLGLDLQGGSYLLLEIDTDPLIEEKIQNKVLPIKKLLKSNGINYQNFSVTNKEITFKISDNNFKKFENLFLSKNDNILNPYISKYNSYELKLIESNNNIKITFSKYGILTINNSALNQSIEIVRRRIDDVGTKEPTILQRGDKRILVELPGVKDPERIKELIGKTAQLHFRLVANESNEFGYDEIKSETGESLTISKKIIVSGDNLVDAQPRVDNQSNEPSVSFTLDRLGAQKFGKATTDYVGKRIAIVLDNKIISSPSVREPIPGGKGSISGNFTFQEATDLALLLRSGALPTPLNIVEERTVGPDLGEDSIRSGSISLIVGFLLVIIFMIFKYRFFGLVANISLITNLLMLMGVLTLLEATLTLPGIAGIILTVGMAVDANVLIFERIKEELKTEKSIIHAFDIGYNKAKITVLDANITTLIATAILFIFGSGPIKGFAVTLGIGILTTLFSAYFIARHITSIIVLRNKEVKI
ncbi:MAG: protein translocase subunit SecD [Pelagibacteraceae bacterium]